MYSLSLSFDMYIYIYTYVFILKLLGLTFASIYTYVSIICFHLIYDSQKTGAQFASPVLRDVDVV